MVQDGKEKKQASFDSLSDMIIRNYIPGIILLFLTLTLVHLPFTNEPRITLKAQYRADIQFEKGLDYLRGNQLTEAETEFKRVVSIQPAYAPHHYFLAETYARQGKTAKALYEFGRTIYLDPEMYQAYYRRGILLGSKKRYSEGIDDLKRAIALCPYFANAYQTLKEIYISVGDFKSAEKVDRLRQQLEEQR